MRLESRPHVLCRFHDLITILTLLIEEVVETVIRAHEDHTLSAGVSLLVVCLGEVTSLEGVIGLDKR